MKDDSLQRWQDRIARAAILLASRLDDPPTLEELAQAAHVSAFHLHRIWRQLTGETVGSTLARLRVEAAKHLLVTSGSVTKTAMAVGFSSSQSFARFFRSHTGLTPSDFVESPQLQEISSPNTGVVRLELQADRTVVALYRAGGEYRELNALFGTIWQWAEQADVLINLAGIFGIPLDDPMSVPSEALRYVACFDLGSAAPPLPFYVYQLPVGQHAVLRHIGSYSRLEVSTQSLIHWLVHSGRDPADAPIYHQFLNDPDQTPEGELMTDIFLPLREVTP